MQRVHVTEALKLAGLINGDFYTEEGRDRGSAVHLACQFDDEGDLDESTLDPVIAPYLEAYRKFKAENSYKWEFIEKYLEHPTYPYCGTLDRYGLVNGRRTIADIKTGSANPSHRIQTAAYSFLIPGHKPIHRMVIRLSDDGSYALDNFGIETFLTDVQVFLSALQIINFKRLYGIK